MNFIQNTMSNIQNKLIEVESCIVESESGINEGVVIEQINNKIAEIRNLALTLPEYYSSDNYSTDQWIKKTFFMAIKWSASAMEIKNMNSLQKDIQKIVGYIQLHFSLDSSFNELDHECIWLCPTMIQLLRATSARVVQLDLGSTAYNAIIENDFTVYDWLLKLAIAEIINEDKASSFIVISRSPGGMTHEKIDRLRKESIAILKNASDKLKYKTYIDLRLQYDVLENSVIPQFESLCFNYNKLVEEIKDSGDLSIWPNVCALLLEKDVADIKNEAMVHEAVKIILSMSQIIACYNREIFCSLMKLSSATNYSEIKQKTLSFKLRNFVPNSKEMPFDKVFELYQKLLSEGRFKQQEYTQLHRTICDHPELATASLPQILFFIEQSEWPFVAKKMIHTVALNGVFSYPGIESLSLSDYASLLCIAIRYQCNGVCKDLMQLKQYNLFLPNEHSFSMIVRESLNAGNALIFESLMQHPAFASMYPGFLRDCIEKVTRNAVHGDGEWRRILILLTAKIENQFLL